MNLNLTFKVVTLIISSIFLGFWWGSLFSGSDITAILFLIALLFGFLFVLSYNKIIKFPDSKKVLEEKKEIQIISKEIIHNLMEKAELELTQIKIQTQSYVDAFGNSSMSDDEKKEFNDFTSLLNKYSTEKDNLFEG